MLNDMLRKLRLNKEAALTAIVNRMSRLPDYRPRHYPPGDAGVRQAKRDLADLKETMRGVQTEGDS